MKPRQLARSGSVPPRLASFAAAAGACAALLLAAACNDDHPALVPEDIGTGDPGTPPVQVSLRVTGTPAGGQVTVHEGSFLRGTCRFWQVSGCELRFLGGERVTLAASPLAGWRFDRWAGCEVARQPTVEIRMPKQDLACEARFFHVADGFDLSVAPDRIDTVAGIQATATLAIDRGANFVATPVRFELVDAPFGITLAEPAGAVTGDTAALAIAVSRSTAPGHHLIRVRASAQDANGQPLQRDVTLAIVVDDPASSFYLTLDAKALSISRGTSCPVTVSAGRSSAYRDDPIDLTALSLPPGVTAAFDEDPLVGNATRWVLTARDDAPFGETEVSVAGSARGKQRQAELRLAVTSARDSCATGRFVLPTLDDFDVGVGQASLLVAQGQNASIDIRIDRARGFSGDVFLSVGHPPTGVLFRFDPVSPISGDRARLTVLTTPTAQRGSSTVVLTATGGSKIHTASFQLGVTPGAGSCPLMPVADAFVSPFWGQAPASILQVGSHTLDRAAKAYLAFDATQIAQPFDKVELVLTLFQNAWAAADPGSTRTMALHGITDDGDWLPSALGEAFISWNNAPKNETQSTVAFTGAGTAPTDPVRTLETFVVRAADAPNTSYRIDVTDYVRWGLGLNAGYVAAPRASRDQDGILTILLGNDSPYHVAGADDYTTFYSRENPQSCLRPHLEVYR